MLELLLALSFAPRPATWSAPRTSQRARLAVAAAGPLEDKLGWLEDTLGWLEDKLYFQLAKRRYDEQLAKRPRRIILVRHGQSQGNVDDKVYATVPDSQIALTERGFAQAVVAGLQIRSLVGNGTVRVFYSPYLRTKQTMLAILQAFDSQRVLLSSEPRLREQDFALALALAPVEPGPNPDPNANPNPHPNPHPNPNPNCASRTSATSRTCRTAS